jgi:F-type H+-transporting ATPase subunit b
MESLRAFCARVGTAVPRTAGVLFLSVGFLLCLDQAYTASESGHNSSGKTHRDGGHGESALAVVWKWGNFLILFGGLGWYLRKPLKDFLESRTRSIQEGLANGRLAKEMAAKQLSEIESRLAHVDEEIRAFKTQALSEAEEERSRILESAKVEARKILELAQREIDGIKKSARLELKSHIAELAVRLAEERLQKSVGSEENRRLVLQFLDSLEVAKN